MDATTWDKDDMIGFLKDVLGRLDMLSGEKATWNEVEERNGPAKDGKWQVIFHPKQKGLSVNGSKKVIIVPEKFRRTLTQESPAGALPACAHELTHVLQCEYDLQTAQDIPLARIKGRRAQTLREEGGIEEERAFQGYFGRSRRTNLHYLRALAAKEQGGNQLQAARAFYDSYRQGKQLDAEGLARARELAVDRALRLFRHGGHNSQPLDYVNQELFRRVLGRLPGQRRRALFIAHSSFSLSDTARLHQAGLLNIRDRVGINPAEVVYQVFTEKYLPRILVARRQPDSSLVV